MSTTASFHQDITFNDQKPAITVLLETGFTKEIRIALRSGQQMKEHKTPYPIVVHVIEGLLEFGVAGAMHTFPKGAMIALEGNIPHNLTALEDSLIRLTLNKQDSAERVQQVADKA